MARRTVVVALSLSALLLSIATPASGDDAILTVALTGAAEVPGPGDPDASGSAVIYIDDDTDRLCLRLQYSNVDVYATGLHIHRGSPTAFGPIVVPFTGPFASPYFECLAVADEALLDDISVNPQGYYLNLHSTARPGGAIRGQLTK